MKAALAPFEPLIEKYSVVLKVPADLIRAIILTESSGNPNAKGPAGDYGLMQVTLPTARHLGFLGAAEELLDPDTNIRLGTTLLARIQARGIESLAELYSTYNAGDPQAYKTNPVVAVHVQHFLNNCASIELERRPKAMSKCVGI